MPNTGRKHSLTLNSFRGGKRKSVSTDETQAGISVTPAKSSTSTKAEAIPPTPVVLMSPEESNKVSKTSPSVEPPSLPKPKLKLPLPEESDRFSNGQGDTKQVTTQQPTNGTGGGSNSTGAASDGAASDAPEVHPHRHRRAAGKMKLMHQPVVVLLKAIQDNKPLPTGRYYEDFEGAVEATMGVEDDFLENISYWQYFRLYYFQFFQDSAIFGGGVIWKTLACIFMSLVYHSVSMHTSWNMGETMVENDQFFNVVGLCVSFSLVFKTKLAYGRFWEARTHMGEVMVSIRSMGVQFVLLQFHTSEGSIPAGNKVDVQVDVQKFHRYLRLYYSCLTLDLRGEKSLSGIPKSVLLDHERAVLEGIPRRSMLMLQWLRMEVHQLVKTKQIGTVMELYFSRQLDYLLQATHSALKVATTPVPYPYEQLVRMTTYVYCLSVPVTFVSTFGYYSFIPTILVGLSFFGLAAVAAELVDPFGHDPSDMPLSSWRNHLDTDLSYFEESMTTRLQTWNDKYGDPAFSV